MVEKQLEKLEQPVDILFNIGTLLVQRPGREIQIECAEVHMDGRKPLFSILYSQTVDTGDAQYRSYGGSMGISKEVALSGLSELVRRSILREITTIGNTSSPEDSE